MDVAYLFIDLVAGTVAFLTYFFPFTLFFVVLWGCGLVSSTRRPPTRPGAVARWCILPAGLTVGVLTVGSVCANRGDGPPLALPQYLIVGLVLAHLPLAVVFGRRAGEQWPVVAASWAAWGWVSVCAALVAGMSVTGVWL
jgi:hypothetical protein